LAACVQCVIVCCAFSGARADETIWPGESWAVSTPEEQGLDSGALARLVDTVGLSRQDSLLVIRHGHIVLDAYYAPFEAGIRHDLRSVTKSIVSTLTAIEIRDGYLDSVDHPVVDLFSDKAITNLDDNKKAMTVQSLLDMTSGIDWQEKNYTPDETISKMYESADRAAFVLDQKMSGAPGTRFYYNSGNPYVLSALITRKTGQNAFEFAKKELFGPLGIQNVRWGVVDAQGVTDGESGLYLTPYGMARIGYLYLHDGVWDGKQIIPVAWVERARAGVIGATFGLHYGNLWWSLPEKSAFMALGRHSQMIVVLPKLDVVAVMTGVLRDDEYYPIARLVDDIAGTVRSDGALPPDAVAQSLLAASIRAAATERPSPVGETPELAKAISGKVYRFADNKLHLQTMSLHLVDAQPSWEVTAAGEAPDHATERFGGPIGLDGVFRKGSPARYGIDAVKGRWVGEDRFLIDRRVLGRSQTQSWLVRFGDKTIDVMFATSDGTKAEMHGDESD
jgi:CubicO group peptidase (beta-lactamase class C family)